MNNSRSSAVLMGIFSLPSEYGIGTLGKAAYKFVDSLVNSGHKAWELLPIGPTAFGNSPYAESSAFAGNPYFIDLTLLAEEGILKEDEFVNRNWGSDPRRVDYGAMYFNRIQVLKIAYNREKDEMNLLERQDYIDFKESQASWLHDYALFTAIKKTRFNDQSWLSWAEDIKKRYSNAIAYYNEACKDEVEFYKYVQYLFFKQWSALKKYANENGIQLIGDLAFCPSTDSADAWAHSELFSFDWNLNVTEVAGCAPEPGSPLGQKWANPTYNWNNQRCNNYEWWVARFAQAKERYDVIRLDHFNGFAKYWAVPEWAENGINGTEKDGPGMDLFNTVKAQLGELDIIAEDLGYCPAAETLLAQTGFTGMKILQYAFGGGYDSKYLPQNYFNPNCAAYIGTHDNSTCVGFLRSASDHEHHMMRQVTGEKDANLGWALIRLQYFSVAKWAIVTMQDILGLDDSARYNTPGTCNENNWSFRFLESDFYAGLEKTMATLAKDSNR